MHETFGSPPSQALRLAIIDLFDAGLIERSPFDTLVDQYRTMGVSEAAGKRAAVGREH